ncbi:response regulator transcription factor [Dyadobacter alkalitolerans]|uniref:response regulator transcription factor n=1 Tax=Dyadobacter alkalitolerans TaxID=492736 RepID=UPI00042A2050|nr:response regulator transcription factor [Dyadobacter alkalitolerans]
MLGPELDLIVLGLNRESPTLTTFLIEKILAPGPQVPVTVLYEVFDVELLRHFGNHTLTGFIAKDNESRELDKCITTVLSGSFYMCEKTSQHVINAVTNPARQNRKPYKKKVAPMA